jgi:hypothetical protein
VAHDLAVAVEVHGPDLARTPVCEPQPAVVPARPTLQDDPSSPAASARHRSGYRVATVASVMTSATAHG